MATGMLHLHNILRWVILILLLASVIKSFTGWQSKKALTNGDKKLWLITMVFVNITFVVGLYLLLFGRFGVFTTTLPEGTSVMKDSFYRFFWVEHPLLNIIAVALISIGRGQAKKAIPDTTKYKKAFWFFFIALIVLLISIPWPGREIGRPLFPGM